MTLAIYTVQCTLLCFVGTCCMRMYMTRDPLLHVSPYLAIDLITYSSQFQCAKLVHRTHSNAHHCPSLHCPSHLQAHQCRYGWDVKMMFPLSSSPSPDQAAIAVGVVVPIIALTIIIIINATVVMILRRKTCK